MGKKKIKMTDLEPDWKQEPLRYYWCSNCGYHGDFGKVKHRGLDCTNCGYDDLCKLDKEEFEND